jgi:hypothetical protein
MRLFFTAHLPVWLLVVAGSLLAVAADGPPRGFRQLAPGVLTVLPADRAADHTVQRVDLPEITVAQADLAWKPKRAPASTTMVERAKARDARLDVWCLEFAFKPPRRIDVDVPVLDRATGELKMRVTPCWYLVYRVKNVGWRRTVTEDDPTKRSLQTFEKPVRFMPHFVLESLEGLSDDEGPTAYRGYLDRIVPAAMEPIRRRENPPGKLFDSASIAENELAPDEERWGVAVWENVDPRIDFFSIYAQGLTNATRWRPKPAGRDADSGDETDETLESLRLDFWRPGAAGNEPGDEMTLGYAGIFERMKLAALVNEAVGRPTITKSNPTAGLALLGLKPSDLDETDDSPRGRFAPLVSVLNAAAKLPAGPRRIEAVRNLLGDRAAVGLDEAERAVGPQAEGKPLEFLAALVREASALPEADRRRRMAAVLGPAAVQIDGLVREVAIARRMAVLDAAGMTPDTLSAAGPLAVFDAVDAAAKGMGEDARRRFMVGLFGPRGPALYAAATEVHEGIDHAWVFRYEIDVPPEENRR